LLSRPALSPSSWLQRRRRATRAGGDEGDLAAMGGALPRLSPTTTVQRGAIPPSHRAQRSGLGDPPPWSRGSRG
jgi:hypothetical protein